MARKGLPILSVSQLFALPLDVEFHVLSLLLCLLVVLVKRVCRDWGV